MDNREHKATVLNPRDRYNVLARFRYKKLMNCCGAVGLYDWDIFCPEWDFKHIRNFVRKEFCNKGNHDSLNRSMVSIIVIKNTALHRLCEGWKEMEPVYEWKNHITGAMLIQYNYTRPDEEYQRNHDKATVGAD